MDQGYVTPSAQSGAFTASPNHAGSGGAFRQIVALFGLIWLLNAGFQFSGWFWLPEHGGGAGLVHAFTAATGHAPAWARGYLGWATQLVREAGPHGVALGMVAVALLIGLSLISRIGLRAACWLGMAYSLFCWTTLDAFGYPYSHGQTDPGVFVNYLIAFVFVLSVAPMISPGARHAAAPQATLWTTGRLLFGLLWAFDAVLKWQPYLLTHFLGQLTPAAQGQPAWIAAYIGFVAGIVRTVGPTLVAVVVAMLETAIALSLLSGRWLRVSVPFGFVYSLAVWTTAEGWGGPYSSAGTGVRGNVVGNVLIYAVIFLFFMVPLRQAASDRGPTAA